MIHPQKATKFLVCFATLIFHLISFGQDVIASQGGSYIGIGVELDFTIGEPVVESLKNQTTEIYAGFHQPHWSVLDVKDFSSTIQATVFPNPTEDVVHIKLDHAENLRYLIYDEQGRLIYETTNHALETTLNLEKLSMGVYNLIIQFQEEFISSVKLIKTI